MKNDSSDSRPRPRWKQWLIQRLDLTAQTREDLLDELQCANHKNLLSSDAVDMIEGVIQFSVLQVRDVMIPSSQVHFIHHEDDFPSILKCIAETEHSRYPVVDDNRDDLVGVLLAKDLLRYIGCEDTFNINDIIRPALIVPETQPLNRLLAEFRNSRSHMAMVIDEYAGIAGLVTFEDILEQIVGDIDDEHDDEEDESAYISAQGDGRFIVQGIMPIEDFNEALDVHFNESEADTIAGVIINALGKIPQQGDEILMNGLNVRILKGDSRRILSLEVLKNPPRRISNNFNSKSVRSVITA